MRQERTPGHCTLHVSCFILGLASTALSTMHSISELGFTEKNSIKQQNCVVKYRH